ncbi:glycine-rich domain-containing protein [Chitinimonas naiadis]
MRSWMMVLVVCLTIYLGYRYWRMRQWQAGRRHIARYAFPPGLSAKLALRYPALSASQLGQVEAGLRQFFQISQLARGRRLGMPSQAVDELWHEFILHTRHYQTFCQAAFGRFLHHTPASGMAAPAEQRRAIRRSWQLCCQLEGLNPASPKRLPLLFGLDAALGIAGGFHYVAQCQPQQQDGSAAAPYCGSDVGCSSDGGSGGCSSDSSNASADGGGVSSDSGGDSGCSGGGCGGGGD